MDSGFEICEKTQFRVGTMIGSGIGGLPLIEKTHETLSKKGARRISPFLFRVNYKYDFWTFKH